jgi:hypothetical protein
MFDYEIIGYSLDCEVYCETCADARIVRLGFPIFAGSEIPEDWRCAECGYPLLEEV